MLLTAAGQLTSRSSSRDIPNAPSDIPTLAAMQHVPPGKANCLRGSAADVTIDDRSSHDRRAAVSQRERESMIAVPKDAKRASSGLRKQDFPGQVVLVLQGGGALGAYQAGVYEAFHEAGIEPDWVIGTSIGAINGAIIAGNQFDNRLQRLRNFWKRVERRLTFVGTPQLWPGLTNATTNLAIMASGIPGFFSPNLISIWGIHAHVGMERASFYSTEALRKSLLELVDFERLQSGPTRFTVGAVNVRSGEMRYFDSRDQAISPEHVMASSALPPAFPAVCIDGEPYWDGGIYSNTPIEAVFDDYPRRSSVVFAVQVWHAEGPEPKSIWQVLGRQKDI